MPQERRSPQELNWNTDELMKMLKKSSETQPSIELSTPEPEPEPEQLPQSEPEPQLSSTEIFAAAYRQLGDERVRNLIANQRERIRTHADGGDTPVEIETGGAFEQEQQATAFFEEESRVEAETGNDLLQHLPVDKKDPVYAAVLADIKAFPEIGQGMEENKKEELHEDAGRKARRAMDAIRTEKGAYLHAGQPVETRADLEIVLRDLTDVNVDQQQIVKTFEAMPAWMQYTLKALEAEHERIQHVEMQGYHIGTKQLDQLSEAVGDRLREAVTDRMPLPLIDPTGVTLDQKHAEAQEAQQLAEVRGKIAQEVSESKFPSAPRVDSKETRNGRPSSDKSRKKEESLPRLRQPVIEKRITKPEKHDTVAATVPFAVPLEPRPTETAQTGMRALETPLSDAEEDKPENWVNKADVPTRIIDLSTKEKQKEKKTGWRRLLFWQ